jgi:hypothetical protein
VLDLLIEHKTSKEIARELGISPHTVDQRIQFAKEKLGANSRSEVAQLYRQLVEICGQLTYQDFPYRRIGRGGRQRSRDAGRPALGASGDGSGPILTSRAKRNRTILSSLSCSKAATAR